MAMFIADRRSSSSTAESSLHQQQPIPPASCSAEANAPAAALSRSTEQSSRYENVASSVPPSSRPCPDPFLLHRLSSPRPSVPSPPLSPGTLSARSRRALSLSRPAPGSCFAKAKFLYDHTPLRHFGPWLLLLVYALLGALLFFWLEAANERRLLRKESAQLERLRNETLQKLARAGRGYLELMARNGREVLVQFERELGRIKLPEAMAWNFWGALFYVQTVFTTIGYGNITPRTTAGQAMSILYAIIGIPLVLALLSQTSRAMTRWFSQKWISYRQRVRKHVRRKKEGRGQREAEEGEKTEKEKEEAEAEDGAEGMKESRTIPVWLALTLVGGYVCTIAAIFLVWESRWSYFTSFYFICISCLTIGLGDVVPDHPYMLILMFVFVILGLSFVSMLISVIQIKMEEWLYRMLMRMQKEYQKALDGVADPVERERIIAQLFAQEPWYMRELAPLCVSEKQTAKLDAMAEQFERLWTPTNTRAIQTEDGGPMGGENGTEERAMGGGAEEAAAVGGSQRQEWTTGSGDAGKSAGGVGTSRRSMLLTSRTDSFRSANSVSDATSLPMDPASMVPRTAQQQTQTEEGWPTPREDIGIGTEEEEGEGEATKGGKKMESRGTQMRPTITNKRVDTEGLVERKESGIGTDEEEAKRRKKQESRGTQMRPTIMNNKRVDTAGLVVRKESGIGTEPAAKMECREAQTEDEEGGKKKRRGKGRLARDDSIDEERAHNHRGVQYSPPALRHAKCQTEPMAIQECLDWVEGPSQQRERSESVQVVIGDEMDQLMDMAYPERRSRPEKRDLVIQTDDSYLRIARRLDNLRTAKSEINVYCTGVGIPKRAQSGPGRRKSLRFLEPAVQQIRDSFRRHGKGGGEEKGTAREAGTSEAAEWKEAEKKQSQSLSPSRPEGKRKKQVRLPPEEGEDGGEK